MPQHLLIVSAGRRCLLVRYFQQAFSHADCGVQVLAADMAPDLSSACQAADGYLATPAIQDPDYIDRLLELCQANDIRVAIPTIDTDLLMLAENRDRFAMHGIELLVSDQDLVRQCRDKRLTVELFARHGVCSPAQVDPRQESAFPLIAKPYDGSSSNNLHVVRSVADLHPRLLEDTKLVFFEYLSREEHDEYTVDMYFDRDSVLKCFVPRLRIETRAGEVSKGRTVKLPALDSLREKFQHLPGARGCLTMQLFVRTIDGKLSGIEINPRFGGGYPLSYEAGANFPAWIVSEYFHHENIRYFDAWQDRLTMLRYDAHVLVSSAA
ncbi:MAG: ATP-grasp domain-containing protein [Pirellulales bacterium]|nr:ATP-grasp domain-containing protein [Pirellulales bacterium]